MNLGENILNKVRETRYRFQTCWWKLSAQNLRDADRKNSKIGKAIQTMQMTTNQESAYTKSTERV